MDNEAAAKYLSQFLNRSLRIHTNDGRMFTGQMRCTDKDRNIILSSTYEYRRPSEEAVRKAIADSGKSSAAVNMDSRYVGMVVVPGEYITKIEYEEPEYAKGQVVP